MDIRVQIETKAKEDLKVRPDGLLGFRPSTIAFEDVIPGSTEDARVVLFNNDTRAHTYTITSLFENSKIVKKTYLTHSFAAMPDATWIRHAPKIRIEPGGSLAARLRVAIPDDPAHLGKKWEEILLIQPDQGRAAFVRVQVKTREKATAD